jgi:hypothetical protein
MNRDLQDVMTRLNELVEDPSTLTSLTRLGDTFNLAADAGAKIVPVQTVCDYFNYWTTYLPGHFAFPTPFGYAERVLPPGIVGSVSPNQNPRDPIDNYSGGQSDGRYSNQQAPLVGAPPGVFDPLNHAVPPVITDPTTAHNGVPILHGPVYGPTGLDSTGQPNCQAGQFGYPLGDARIPGQSKDNPAAGTSQISGPGSQAGVPSVGRTDLFLEQNGDRIFWDQANNPPENP